MFTGIIEAIAKVEELREDASNLHIRLSCSFTNELKIDQSIAHNGVCLTVVAIEDNTYTVTAIKETLHKTNLGKLKVGSLINLERCTKVGARLDGHIVQGHVDQTAECISVKDENGSWLFHFRYTPNLNNVVVNKGSICVNGVSLTVVNAVDDTFSVAIIPYTLENTSIKTLKEGDTVNLEFDIIGKYVARLMHLSKDH